jgi:type I restriction enzyme S subunit
MTPQAFLEHFETFAAAPNGIAKLRELILQCAVQGRLCARDKDDEPATSSHRHDRDRLKDESFQALEGSTR